MKNRNFFPLIILIFLGSQGLHLSAQDIGLQVVSGKDVLFGDSTTNEGARLMWIYDKMALRAGEVNDLCSDCWDLDEIGLWSFAFGENPKASGRRSAAWGFETVASGHGSTAWGSRSVASGSGSTAWGSTTEATGSNSTAWGSTTEATGLGSTAWGSITEATGSSSTAWGFVTEASGAYSTSWGSRSVASGDYSTAWGIETTAPSGYETVLGRYNTEYIPSTAFGWDLNDRLLVVGNGVGSVNRSDAMVILKKGNVGLGINQPVALLHLNTLPTGDTTGIKITNNNFNSLFYHDENGHLIIRKQNQTQQLVLDQSGNIGLGTTANTHPLELASGAHCTGAGVWTNASDARLKNNIKVTRYGLKEILSLHPVDYKMIATGEDQVGFIAQQVQKIIPEVVSGIEGDMDKGETLGLSYGNLVAVLTRGIQQQQEELETQRAEIDRLRSDNDKLNQRLANIEKMIDMGTLQTSN